MISVSKSKACLFLVSVFFLFFHSLSLAAEFLDETEYLSLRQKCQTTIEDTLWKYSIWPSVNKKAKPSRADVITNDMIIAKVNKNIANEKLLIKDYGIKITQNDLDNELQRIKLHSKKPERLSELFRALKNNPYLLRQCIARPVLVQKHYNKWVDKFNNPKLNKNIILRNTPTDFFEDAPSPRIKHTAIWTGTRMIIWGGQDENSSSYQTGGIYDPVLDVWSYTAVDDAPKKRHSHSAVWTGTEMLVWGGKDEDNFLLNGKKYNPDLNTWQNISTQNKPKGSVGQIALWTGTHMLIWGGFDSLTMPNTSYGALYNPDNNAWEAMNTLDAPDGLAGAKAVWSGTEALIWGGVTSSDSLSNEGWIYNPSSNAWRAMTLNNSPHARSGHTAVWTGSEMLIWGGTTTTALYSNTGGKYNPQTNNWTSLASANAPSGRFNHASVWTGSEMLIWGGSGNSLDDGGRYNPSSDEWLSFTSIDSPEIQQYSTAIWTGTEMIVWGGDLFTNKGGRYTPSINQWELTSQTYAPSARVGHQVVWTGQKMLVWGGDSAIGGQYDPMLDTWKPMKNSNAPKARTDFGTVWTGTEMLIWGGVDKASGELFTDGKRYNPSNEKWNNISETNKPQTSTGFSVIWTGAEMIVWGGKSATNLLNNGFKYNPISDSWSTISQNNAPLARKNHTAVWTGQEMLIWGGVDSTDATVNTSAKYNANNDMWSPIKSDVNTPRYHHQALWTGDKMLVWGRLNSATNAFKGAIYNPALDSWSLLSTTNQPDAFSGFSMVWTGDELLIWGGENSSGLLNSGKAYNLSSEHWREINSINAPSARKFHSTLWTGDEMLVWGGETLLGQSNTGAKYNVHSDTWVSINKGNVFEINSGVNGIWFYPETSGQGVVFEVLPKLNKVFLAWFTYDIDFPSNSDNAIIGYSGSRWLTGFGDIDPQNKSVMFDLRVTSGGLFDDPQAPFSTAENSYGSAFVSFKDCENARLSYSIINPVNHNLIEGEFPLLRVTHVNDDMCAIVSRLPQIFKKPVKNDNKTDFIANAGLNGTWFNENTPGQGFAIEIFKELNIVFFAWFTYDTEIPNNNPQAIIGNKGHRWFTGGGTLRDDGIIDFDLQITSGGLFDDPTDVTASPVGTVGSATMKFINCKKIEFSYDMPSINRSGVFDLKRISSQNDFICEGLSN